MDRSHEVMQSAETIAVHGGIDHFEFHPVIPPIFQTSTFAFESADHGAMLFSGRGHGKIYSRMGNPTVEALEVCIARLEGGAEALACSSGMAAIHTVLAGLLSAGDHLVCSEVVYGPTCKLIEEILGRFGISSTMVDSSKIHLVHEAIQPNTKVVFIETPGNPTLVVSDLRAVCELAHRHGALVVVDNTFLSPVLQRPLDLGADIVVHSATKFLNGHADVVGGAIVCSTHELHDPLRLVLNHLGGVLPPLEAFLVHRGIKTLALRMRRHCESALTIARYLESRKEVAWVRYPGLESHPQYEISRKQATGGGGVITMELRGGLEAGKRMMNAVRLFTLAVSLGGVESLIEHPASMTHASMGRSARERAHISDGLVRISVGIENPDELIADLDQALASAAEGASTWKRPEASGTVGV